MLKKILETSGVQKLHKNQQRSIKAGSNLGCAQAISSDGTLCLCLGWIPQGGICVNTNP
ncbi:hypothetical protein [Aquimarina sediminis]|uniref:hypothetical protein n=1 Tax=Aquimarina sediminis TaxID=2070536 RepID=UPI0013E8CEEB|nr:hypothetical protein [Aquimarina sediminis]